MIRRLFLFCSHTRGSAHDVNSYSKLYPLIRGAVLCSLWSHWTLTQHGPNCKHFVPFVLSKMFMFGFRVRCGWRLDKGVCGGGWGGGGESLDPRSKTHHHAFTTHFVATSHPWLTWLKVFLCCVQRCCRPRWGDLQVFRHWYSTTTLSSMPNSGLCLLHGATTKNTKRAELAQRRIAL